jgi:hypothetical protein
MHEAYTCQINDHMVSVTETDSAIMLDNATLKAIGDILITRSCKGGEEHGHAPKKRRNNAAIPTHFGANVFTALQQNADCDDRDNA